MGPTHLLGASGDLMTRHAERSSPGLACSLAASPTTTIVSFCGSSESWTSDWQSSGDVVRIASSIASKWFGGQIVRFDQPQIAGQLLRRFSSHGKTAQEIGLPLFQLIRAWRIVLQPLYFVQHHLQGIGR